MGGHRGVVDTAKLRTSARSSFDQRASMGCYPSRADGVTTLAAGDEMSPATSPVAGCCAPVRGQGAGLPSNQGKYTPPAKTSSNGWVDGDDQTDGNTPPGGEQDPAAPAEQAGSTQASQPSECSEQSQVDAALPGAMGEQSGPSTTPQDETLGAVDSKPSSDATSDEQQAVPVAVPTATKSTAPAAIVEQEAPISLPAPQSNAPEPVTSQPVKEKKEQEGEKEQKRSADGTPSKYRAFVPVGGEYVQVKNVNDIDFEAEKAKIEAEFCSLEKALDEGTMARVDIEKRFEVLTNEAARLRKLQAEQKEQAEEPPKQVPTLAPVTLKPVAKAPVKLAPVAAPAGDSSAVPTMAVVHWKGVTKKKFVVYKETILEKYGNGPEGI